MDEDALKQINRLAFHNGRMRFLIGEAITTMLHAETFIRTREKMHPTGIDLWCELVNRLQECLDDQHEPQNVEGPEDQCPKPAPGLAVDSCGVLVRQTRCSVCGGSKPVTGRNDATGECTCRN